MDYFNTKFIKSIKLSMFDKNTFDIVKDFLFIKINYICNISKWLRAFGIYDDVIFNSFLNLIPVNIDIKSESGRLIAITTALKKFKETNLIHNNNFNIIKRGYYFDIENFIFYHLKFDFKESLWCEISSKIFEKFENNKIIPQGIEFVDVNLNDFIVIKKDEFGDLHYVKQIINIKPKKNHNIKIYEIKNFYLLIYSIIINL